MEDNIENMSITELYTKLYNENFEELERLRKKQFNLTAIVFGSFIAVFVLLNIAPFLMPVLFVGIIALIIFLIVKSSKDKSFGKNNSYSATYKEKVLKPLLKNQIPSADYNWNLGINSFEYQQAKWESYDRYSSEDLLTVKTILKDYQNVETEIIMAEVHTQDRETDSEGRTRYVTRFLGLAGHLMLPKDIGCYIKIRRNGTNFLERNAIKLDSTEFEKLFDVSTDDKIKAMQLLTSDVMMDMISIVEQSKVKYEIYINNNKMYFRFFTGSMFEPNLTGKAMKLDSIVKYINLTNSVVKTVEDMIKRIMEVEF